MEATDCYVSLVIVDKRRWWLFLVLSLVSAEAKYPQGYPRQVDPTTLFEVGYTGRYWDHGDGLPRGSVTQVAQTTDGYLWILTDGSVYRFDGNQWELLPLEDSAVSVEPVIRISSDSQNRLWLITKREVYRLADRQIELIGSDLGSDLWMEESSNGEVYAISKQEKGLVIYHLIEARQQFEEAGRYELEDTRGVQGVASDDEGNLWISTKEEKLRWNQAAGFRWWKKRGGAFFEKAAGGVGLPTTKAILSYRGKKNGWLRDGRFYFNLREQPQQAVEDAFGNVWIYRHRDSSILVYRKNRPLRRVIFPSLGLERKSIAHLFCDQEGGLWIAAKPGLYQLTPQVLNTPPKNVGSGKSYVNSVVEDVDDKTIWLGGEMGVSVLKEGSYVEKTQATNGSGSLMMTAHSQGGVWFAIRDGLPLGHVDRNGVVRTFDRKPVEERYYLHDLRGLDDGQCLMAVDEELFRFDGSQYHREPLGFDDRVRLFRASSGRIYAAGPGVFERRDDSWQLVSPWDDRPYRLNHLCQDTNGVFWGVMRNGHFWRWQDDDATTVHVPDLSEKRFTGMVADHLDGLWLAVRDEGVLWLDRKALNARANGDAGVDLPSRLFARKEGLPSVKTSEHGSGMHKARDGRVWVATARGAVAIDPQVWQWEREGLLPPRVKIHSVTLGDRVIEMDPLVGTVEEEWHLAATHRQLAIEVTPLVYHKADPRLVYRLRGLGEEWIPAGGNRTIRYPQLAPGEYTFEVQAARREGEPFGEVSTWSFRVGSAPEPTIASQGERPWQIAPLTIGFLIALGWILHRMRTGSRGENRR